MIWYLIWYDFLMSPQKFHLIFHSVALFVFLRLHPIPKGSIRVLHDVMCHPKSLKAYIDMSFQHIKFQVSRYFIYWRENKQRSKTYKMQLCRTFGFIVQILKRQELNMRLRYNRVCMVPITNMYQNLTHFFFFRTGHHANLRHQDDVSERFSARALTYC